jgi:hypothetical protein
VRPPPDATVQNDATVAGQLIGDLAENVQGRNGSIELTPSVVRQDDRGRAIGHRLDGIVSPQ